MGKLFHTCFMSSQNSSKETKIRAKQLSATIGANHLNCDIDTITDSLIKVFTCLTGGFIPRFRVHGGSWRENVALQNIQARCRMVLTYLIAQLLPLTLNCGLDSSGSLLVLGSGNVDEALRGYYTKYDSSSADINPIGSISKGDLCKFVAYARDTWHLTCLDDFLDAKPTAELEPIIRNNDETVIAQTDEADMGVTYKELGMFGKLRKLEGCGPVGMFKKLSSRLTTLSMAEIADKVKHFFRYYAINRHKMTTLTPAVHAEAYSCDDNRYDMRPFLYNSQWQWQFEQIDKLVVSPEPRP